MQPLRARLAAYDGRATSMLGEAEAAFGDSPEFLEWLLALMSEEEGHIANGASWLLKAALERGERLDAGQVRQLSQALPKLPDWAAQLHVCQSIGYLDVPPDCAPVFADWLVPLLEHERPFVRAWVLDALAHLAAQHGAYRDAAKVALAKAEQDEAASVKARARGVAKRLGMRRA